jgi:hypothetical protein
MRAGIVARAKGWAGQVLRGNNPREGAGDDVRSARIVAQVPRRLPKVQHGVKLGSLLAASLAPIVAPCLAYASPSQQAVALKKFEEGRVAFEQGKFEQALVAFQASIEILPSPNSRLYIARCYRALGKPASAYLNFQQAMREAQDRFAATGERRYTATQNTAAQEATQIESKIARLTVAVPSDAPPAMVLAIDADVVPRVAWGTAMETDPGKHDLHVSGGRVRPMSLPVELRSGDKKRVDLHIERLPTATIALTFKSKPPGLTLEIDGAAIEPTQIEVKQELDVGAHTVIVRAPGYAPFEWKRSMIDGERADVRVDLGAARGTPRWLLFATAATGAALAGTGTYFAIKATQIASEERAKDPLLRDPAVQERIKADSLRANILFIAGGTAGLGAAVLAFTTDWKGSRRPEGAPASGWVVPQISPDSVGLVGGGRF